MANTIFITAEVSSNGAVAISVLNKETLKTMFPAMNPDFVKIVANVRDLTGEYPVGTIFAVSNEQMVTNKETDIRILEMAPLLFKNSVLYNPEDKVKVTEENVNDYIQHVLNRYGLKDIEKAKKELNPIIDRFESLTDWKFDKEALFDPKIPETIEEVDKSKSIDLFTWLRHKYPVPSIEDCGMHIEHDLWFRLVRNIIRGKNTMLIGPTGSGKTEIIELISRLMGLNLSIQDMGTVQDAQSALLGVHRLNENNESIFDPAPFVGHVQNEGIILLDEMNRSPLSANNILFPVLDR